MITAKMRIQSLSIGLDRMREEEHRLEEILEYDLPQVEIRKRLLLEAEAKLADDISLYTDVHNAIERRETEISEIMQQEVDSLLSGLPSFRIQEKQRCVWYENDS